MPVLTANVSIIRSGGTMTTTITTNVADLAASPAPNVDKLLAALGRAGDSLRLATGAMGSQSELAAINAKIATLQAEAAALGGVSVPANF